MGRAGGGPRCIFINLLIAPSDPLAEKVLLEGGQPASETDRTPVRLSSALQAHCSPNTHTASAPGLQTERCQPAT